MSNPSNPKVRDVADSFIRQLENGTPPWLKPWRDGVGGGSAHLPRNLISGHCYSGINVPLLWAEAADRGYADSSWLTYRQAIARGGYVRRGEKASTVYFLKPTVVAGEGDEKARYFALLKSYAVFNVAQCEGVRPIKRASPASRPEPERVAHADKLVEKSGARMEFGGDRAFYTTAGDYIRLPMRAAFRDAAGYYGTALHELTHWTGHAARCNREFGKRFGDQAYAAEELVAEIGASLLCAHTGIDAGLQHAAYVATWIKLLTDHPKAIFTAASQAWKAFELVATLAGESTGAADRHDDDKAGTPAPVHLPIAAWP